MVNPTLVITGANGWVGNNVYQALAPYYHLILVDKQKGCDPHNRYGLERMEKNEGDPLPDTLIQQIDLASEYDKFSKLLDQHKPICVIHLASILENQAEDTIIDKNRRIHTTVLEACAKRSIHVIATSSIMIMYGVALSLPNISNLWQNGISDIKHQLDSNTTLNNTEQTIREFDENNWRSNLAYIKSKEFLETQLQVLAKENPNCTMVAIRLGWTGIKNPYELEDKNKKYSEIPFYLDTTDLQQFFVALTEAVLSYKINGYKCYICVSEHAQQWVSIDNVYQELGWKPQVNIESKYTPHKKMSPH